MMKTLAYLLVASLTLGAFTSCSGTRRYNPDEERDPLDLEYDYVDLKQFAVAMADSLLASPNLKYVGVEDKGNDKRPIAVFGGIANETREHINTAQIFREMKPRIVNSGELRLVAGAEDNGQDLIAERVRFEQNSGRVRADMAAELGRQLGADVVVYGVLSDIANDRGRSLENLGTKRKRLYYQFNMTAVNTETAEILWTETTDILKEQTISIFGRG